MYNLFRFLLVWVLILDTMCLTDDKSEKPKNEKQSSEDFNSADCPAENRKYEDVTIEMDCLPFFYEVTPLSAIKTESSEKKSVLNSACINCAACLAVSKKLNAELELFEKDKKYICSACVGKVEHLDLRSVCSTGFKNYGLQELAGKKVISPLMPHSKYISTDEDGKWPNILEEMCTTFVSVYGELNICDDWAAYQDVTDILCRGVGVFGACNDVEKLENEDEFQNEIELETYDRCICNAK